MITRYAFFEGTIKAEMHEAFFAFVAEKLVPEWTQFDGASNIEVHREVERDDGAPGFPLVLAISYPDGAALERAMRCPARYRSRELTGELMQMFDGRIHHHVTHVQRFSPSAV